MLCPKCGEEMEQLEKCPHCGADVMEETSEEVQEAVEAPEAMPEEAAAEAPAEEVSPETEETEEAPAEEEASEEGSAESSAEEAPEETEAAEPEQPKKKKSAAGIVAGVIIALLVVIVVCLGLALKTVTSGGSLPDISQKISDWKTEREDAKFDPEAIGITVTDSTGAVTGELTNEQLAYYYWGEYYYFVNSYGFSFDSSMRLDQQVYDSVTDSATGETTVTTWHQYFLEAACYSINQIEALKAAGEAVGFTMPEDYQAEYEAILESMATNAASAGFTDAEGNGDALAYIQDSYGPDTTMEGFEQYLYDSYYASAYSDSVYYGYTYEESEIEAYFDENADVFAAYGIEKLDVPNVNIRHILVEPEYSEDGTISDEAWEAADAEAQRILQEWLDGEATEDSFGELANTYSADGGSNTVGGLYENVYPGEMVETFNDWCFDASRATGDSGIVKTDYGYHIMYFISHTEEYYWKTVAESDMRYYEGAEYLENLALGYTTAVTGAADIRYPDAVKVIMGTE